MVVFFDFTIDIWRVIVRKLFMDEESTMRLLHVSRNSRKGVLSCFEWWARMYPLRFELFRKIKKETILTSDFPYFCLYFTYEQRLHSINMDLAKAKRYLPVIEGKKLSPKKLKEKQEQHERNLKSIAKYEKEAARQNPIACPITLSKTMHKRILAKAGKEARYHRNIRMIRWLQTEGKGLFEGNKEEQEKRQEQQEQQQRKKRKKKENSESDYIDEREEDSDYMFQ